MEKRRRVDVMWTGVIMLGIVFAFSYYYFAPAEKKKTRRDQADRIHFGRIR